ncbi:unnamed protein product [Didymodactylos carnosus]|uniref:Arb2 domain-containing protein n=1 Tax=Didymodactylos carnosus TaxID=1234261 RepID=A0A8S2GHV0_9BILA|nr:unnamed protein product [Didymodactylos carnosus]CAF3520164.1 unnamed protein product [Didymodactylos carnosus]
MVCIACWTKYIESLIENSHIAELLNGSLKCSICHDLIAPLDSLKDVLPKALKDRLQNILSTIPATTHPTTIDEFNYYFNENDELRHKITHERFVFITQRHYNLLGDCISDYLQNRMKTQWKYKEIWLPFRKHEQTEKKENTEEQQTSDNSGQIGDSNVDDHHDQTNIFISDDFNTNENGCLILIQGSGVVRPNQWARSCCINESLNIGTMFPYMKHAKENNLSVLILNPNQTTYYVNDDDENNNPNDDKDPQSFYLTTTRVYDNRTTKRIQHNETSRKHILYVYDNIIQEHCKGNKLYIVAHSAGGDALMYLLRERTQSLFSRLTSVAFTDSVHSLLPSESEQIKQFLRQNGIHFVASDEPMGTPVRKRQSFYSYEPACMEVSAGHPKHEYTSGHCVDGVFKFFFKKQMNESLHLEDDNKQENDDKQEQDEKQEIDDKQEQHEKLKNLSKENDENHLDSEMA